MKSDDFKRSAGVRRQNLDSFSDDDDKLDTSTESQSDQCGYNERDYAEETRDDRSVSSHERIDMNYHGEENAMIMSITQKIRDTS